MTDENQQPIVEPSLQNPQIVPEGSPVQNKKSNKKRWIILGSIIGGIGICLILCIAFGVFAVVNAAIEKRPVEKVLTNFMDYMAAKDLDLAYSLISTRAKRQFSKDSLEKMVTGNNYILFEGFHSLAVQNLTLKAAANTNPDLPQGTIAEVTAKISYSGGITGHLTAVMEKENGHWKLHGINVTVPPEKIGSK